jgi:hypothetical protein
VCDSSKAVWNRYPTLKLKQDILPPKYTQLSQAMQARRISVHLAEQNYTIKNIHYNQSKEQQKSNETRIIK